MRRIFGFYLAFLSLAMASFIISVLAFLTWGWFWSLFSFATFTYCMIQLSRLLIEIGRIPKEGRSWK